MRKTVATVAHTSSTHMRNLQSTEHLLLRSSSFFRHIVHEYYAEVTIYSASIPSATVPPRTRLNKACTTVSRNDHHHHGITWIVFSKIYFRNNHHHLIVVSTNKSSTVYRTRTTSCQRVDRQDILYTHMRPSFHQCQPLWTKKSASFALPKLTSEKNNSLGRNSRIRRCPKSNTA